MRSERSPPARVWSSPAKRQSRPAQGCLGRAPLEASYLSTQNLKRSVSTNSRSVVSRCGRVLLAQRLAGGAPHAPAAGRAAARPRGRRLAHPASPACPPQTAGALRSGFPCCGGARKRHRAPGSARRRSGVWRVRVRVMATQGERKEQRRETRGGAREDQVVLLGSREAAHHRVRDARRLVRLRGSEDKSKPAAMKKQKRRPSYRHDVAVRLRHAAWPGDARRTRRSVWRDEGAYNTTRRAPPDSSRAGTANRRARLPAT